MLFSCSFTGAKEAWIGLFRSKCNDWAFSEDTPYDFDPNNIPDLDTRADQNCAVLKNNGVKGKDCDKTVDSFICQIIKTDTTTTTPGKINN